MDTEASLMRLEACLAPPDGPPEEEQARIERVLAARDALHDGERRVVFLGAFKSGKSTLINALLGTPLLPARANRATGVVTSVRCGAEPRAELLRRDAAGVVTLDPIPFDSLAPAILLDVSQPIARPPEGVDEARIAVPLPLLEETGTLVDTPGLLDNAALTERSLDEVDRAALVVMVLAADKLLSERERLVAVRVHERLNGNLVFAVNRLDAVAPDEHAAVLAWAAHSLDGLSNGLAGASRIFGTDALSALAARPPTEPATGIEAFLAWLRATMRPPQGQRIALLSRCGVLRARLTALHDACLAGGAAAQETLAAARAAAARQRDEAATTHARAVTRARAQLSSSGIHLDQLGETFVAEAAAAAHRSVAAGQLAPAQLNACLRTAAAAYARGVRQEAQAALSGLGIVVPALRLDVPEPFSGAQGLLAAGRWLAKNPLGTTSDLKAAIPAQMEGAARAALPAMRATAERFLAAISRSFVDANVAGEPEPPSTAIEHATARLSAYHRLDRWCRDGLAAVSAAQDALLRAGVDAP